MIFWRHVVVIELVILTLLFCLICDDGGLPAYLQLLK